MKTLRTLIRSVNGLFAKLFLLVFYFTVIPVIRIVWSMTKEKNRSRGSYWIPAREEAADYESPY